MKNLLKKFLVLTFMAVFVGSYLPVLSADETISDSDTTMDMVVGDLQSVPVKGLTRVSVTNPDVADISDAQNDKVTVIAKKGGSTLLFLWDSDGKRNVRIRVVSEDLTSLKDRIEKLLNEANINGISSEENLDVGKVVLSGEVSKEDKARLGDILQPYVDNVMDLTKEEKSEDLIQVDMEIVEINSSYDENLGILWGTPNANSSSSTSGTLTVNGQTNEDNAGQVGLNYLENVPTGHNPFKIGSFSRTSPLEVTVNALVQEGKAKLISKPRLVVVSGKQASFLVGGEIPVESTTISTTGNTLTSNTTYAQYGVNMSITPTVREGKIDVDLNVDIRDIDASNSSNGNVAFITRSATTNLFMDNKQTVALAGLLKYTSSQQITGIPFLSKLPLIGAAFRNNSTPTPDSNTEMVIILTPTILNDKKYATTQLVMPTPSERDAWNEYDSKYEHEPLTPAVIEKRAEDLNPTTVVSTAMTNAGQSQAPVESQPMLSGVMAYARMVQERISKAIIYPQGSTSAEGTVKLKLHILKDGSLDSAEVIQSSGNVTLDQDAVQAAKVASPYDAFSSSMDESDMVFTVPIVYNKLGYQSQAPSN